MSVRTSSANPIALFWQAFFGKGNSAKQNVLSSTDIASMPRNTQLLLAHSLQRNDPYLTVQDGDDDADYLISEKLLAPIECTASGIFCYRIKPFFWHQLKTSRCHLLDVISKEELDCYRKLKCTRYPWVW
jgi:hypothetical protein